MQQAPVIHNLPLCLDAEGLPLGVLHPLCSHQLVVALVPHQLCHPGPAHTQLPHQVVQICASLQANCFNSRERNVSKHDTTFLSANFASLHSPLPSAIRFKDGPL